METPGESRRVLLVTNSPTPYRLPLFQEIYRQCRDVRIDFLVAFAAAGYGRRQWVLDPDAYEFPYIMLSPRRLSFDADQERTIFSYGGLLTAIRRLRPDLVVVPGFSVATAKLAALTLAAGPPFLIWTGSIPAQGRNNSRVRGLQRRILARRAVGGIAYGTLARKYLLGLGMHSENVHVAVNTVDINFFRDNALAERSRLSGSVASARFTYVGSLSPRKNVGRLIDLMEMLARERRDFALDVVGDGTQREDLERRSREKGLEDLVFFHGFQSQEIVPAFFAKSRCLLFQTDYDIWGLVAIEAMAAGLPVISSVHAGVTHDLIHDAVTGFRADFSDARATLPLLHWMLDNPHEAADIGTRARRFVAEHASLETSAAAFVRAMRGDRRAVPGKSPQIPSRTQAKSEP